MGALPRPTARRVHPLAWIWIVGLRLRIAPLLLQEPPVEGRLRPRDEGVRGWPSCGTALQVEALEAGRPARAMITRVKASLYRRTAGMCHRLLRP